MPGIVLAGGRSLRMGWPKALLPWPPRDVPIVIHVTETLREAGIAPLGVVTGQHHDRIAPVLAGHAVTVLPNPRHAEGQLSSLLHGLRWAFAQTDGEWAMVTLVDVPAVRATTVRALAEATAYGHIRAIRPRIGARHGHPVVWRRDVLPELEAADPAQGARAVMRALAIGGGVLDLDVDDPGVLTDIDTPEDYASSRAHRRPFTIPEGTAPVHTMTLPDITQLTLLTIESARTGDADTLRRALAAGVPVDATTPAGDSLLMLACHHGHVEAARELLARGADVNAPAHDGRTALMAAAASNRVDVVEWLLGHGANREARDASGARALDVARRLGAAEAVQLLTA